MYAIGWDPEKARANLEKHGLRFSDAEVALFDPNAITVEDETSEGERRYVSIGMDALGRILVVVFSYRGRYSPDLGAQSHAQGKNEL